MRLFITDIKFEIVQWGMENSVSRVLTNHKLNTLSSCMDFPNSNLVNISTYE